MKPFTEKTISIITGIPPGLVMTYGQIARMAGSPRGARQVVRILHSMGSAYNLPWHRVINSKGKIAITDEEAAFTQAVLLREEGVELGEGGSIDLSKYQYIPFEE